MIKCYELIDVIILNEKIKARPIGWDREIVDGFGNDINGEQVEAIEFHATCPYCSNLIHFFKDDIYKDVLGNDNIKCTSCNSGNGPMGIPLDHDGELVDVFVDPIELGLFSFEVDEEKLFKLDNAESSISN